MCPTCMADENLTPEQFTDMCEVTADVSELVQSLQPQRAADGSKYYEIRYEIVLLFGLTELKAQIRWMDKVRFVIASNKLDYLHII